MPEIEGLIVKMKADTSDYDAKLKAMQTQTVSTSEKVKSAFSNISTVAAAASVALTGFAMSAVKSSIEWGKSVDDLVDKTGMMGEEASKLLGIAKAGGVSAEEANMAFAKLSRTISQSADAQFKANQEGKQSADVFTKLGIAVMNNDGTMKASLDIYKDVAKSVREMEDGWQKTALEMELFGRAGANLHDMLNFTQEEMDATIKKMEAMGLVMSKEDAAAAEKLDRQIKGLTGTMAGLGRGIGNEVLPHIRELVTALNGAVKAFVGLEPEVRSNIIQVVKLGIEIGITTKIITSVVGAARGAAVALGLMEAATWAAVGPWGALAAAIGLAIAALVDWFNTQGQVESYNKNAEVHVDKSRPGKHMKKVLKEPEEKISFGFGSEIPDMGGVSHYEMIPLTEAEEEAQAAFVAGKNLKTPERKESGGYIPPVTGGGGAGGGGGAEAAKEEKSAYEDLLEVMQKDIDLLDRKRRMYEITQDEYIAALNQQIKGLEDVAVTEEEEADRALKIYDIRLQLQELHEKEIDGQIKRISNEKELGELEVQNAENKLKHAINLAKIGFAGQESDALKDEHDKNKVMLQSKYDFEVAEANKRIAIYSKEGEAKKEELEREQQGLLVLAKRYNNDREALDADYVEKNRQAQQKIIDKNNDTIKGLIMGTKSMHDVLLDQWDQFIGSLVQKMFKIDKETNIFQSLLGGLFGSGGGGGESEGFPNISDIFEGRATGGPVNAGQPYIVGEKRPELFVPDTNGTIIPDLSALGGQTVNQVQLTQQFTFNGKQDMSVVEQIRSNAALVEDIVINALNNKTAMRNAAKGAAR